MGTERRQLLAAIVSGATLGVAGCTGDGGEQADVSPTSTPAETETPTPTATETPVATEQTEQTESEPTEETPADIKTPIINVYNKTASEVEVELAVSDVMSETFVIEADGSERVLPDIDEAGTYGVTAVTEAHEEFYPMRVSANHGALLVLVRDDEIEMMQEEG